MQSEVGTNQHKDSINDDLKPLLVFDFEDHCVADIVYAAIVALNEKNGSSKQDIMDYILANYEHKFLYDSISSIRKAFSNALLTRKFEKTITNHYKVRLPIICSEQSAKRVERSPSNYALWIAHLLQQARESPFFSQNPPELLLFFTKFNHVESDFPGFNASFDDFSEFYIPFFLQNSARKWLKVIESHRKKFDSVFYCFYSLLTDAEYSWKPPKRITFVIGILFFAIRDRNSIDSTLINTHGKVFFDSLLRALQFLLPKQNDELLIDGITRNSLFRLLNEFRTLYQEYIPDLDEWKKLDDHNR